MLLGELIEYWRRIKGETQRETAKAIGIGYSVLCRLEKGHLPDGVTLVKVWNWATKLQSKERK